MKLIDRFDVPTLPEGYSRSGWLGSKGRETQPKQQWIDQRLNRIERLLNIQQLRSPFEMQL